MSQQPETNTPTVRFHPEDEEIAPETSLEPVQTLTGLNERDDLSPEAKEELRKLAVTMQRTRMQNFNFEPVSLPHSRAPSPTGQNRIGGTPKPSPPVSTVHTPPLTPAGSRGREGSRPSTSSHGGKISDASVMTPQTSPPHELPPTSIPSNEQRSSSAAQARLPRSSNARPRSVHEATSGVPTHPKQPPTNILPRGDSPAASQDPSPTNTPRPGTPGTPSEAQSPRPRTPLSAPVIDPYGAAKALQNLDSITGQKRGSAYGSQTSLDVPNGSGAFKAENKRHTGLFGRHDDKHHSSMSDLKRFFKIGKKDKKEARSRQGSRQSSPHRASIASVDTGTTTPPSSRSSIALPFSDDHSIESRYGKFGKVLGSGAGGSVRLMKRASDGVTFAVKQFRDRHSYESEQEYRKKVTSEFCLGSTLHHGNIIETMDIVQEKGRWYEVMEYAPFDLFAIVMTGKMSREEICCSTLQIISGVQYLHEMGLAHRDLKLDNVVVNEHGIMKIIDFGSAVVFRFPWENGIVLASGIVGSDPYLAPEVYDVSKYDPRPTDIWSLAIIFCCMTLRRFPWKAPRTSDNSYKLFITEPTEEERRSSLYPQKPVSEPASRAQSSGDGSRVSSDGGARSEPDARSQAPASSDRSQPQTIKGPWRLLRLLPRETRHIIGRMLEIDPHNRATLEEVLNDPWVAQNMHGNKVCSQDSSGGIHRAAGHEHTLEPALGAKHRRKLPAANIFEDVQHESEESLHIDGKQRIKKDLLELASRSFVENHAPRDFQVRMVDRIDFFKRFSYFSRGQEDSFLSLPYSSEAPDLGERPAETVPISDDTEVEGNTRGRPETSVPKATTRVDSTSQKSLGHSSGEEADVEDNCKEKSIGGSTLPANLRATNSSPGRLIPHNHDCDNHGCEYQDFFGRDWTLFDEQAQSPSHGATGDDNLAGAHGRDPNWQYSPDGQEQAVESPSNFGPRGASRHQRPANPSGRSLYADNWEAFLGPDDDVPLSVLRQRLIARAYEEDNTPLALLQQRLLRERFEQEAREAREAQLPAPFLPLPEWMYSAPEMLRTPWLDNWGGLHSFDVDVGLYYDEIMHYHEEQAAIAARHNERMHAWLEGVVESPGLEAPRQSTSTVLESVSPPESYIELPFGLRRRRLGASGSSFRHAVDRALDRTQRAVRSNTSSGARPQRPRLTIDTNIRILRPPPEQIYPPNPIVPYHYPANGPYRSTYSDLDPAMNADIVYPHDSISGPREPTVTLIPISTFMNVERWLDENTAGNSNPDSIEASPVRDTPAGTVASDYLPPAPGLGLRERLREMVERLRARWYRDRECEEVWPYRYKSIFHIKRRRR